MIYKNFKEEKLSLLGFGTMRLPLNTEGRIDEPQVEKMIKYGAKTLYSINFDNVGRRLLDPTLTEIKKS